MDLVPGADGNQFLAAEPMIAVGSQQALFSSCVLEPDLLGSYGQDPDMDPDLLSPVLASPVLPVLPI